MLGKPQRTKFIDHGDFPAIRTTHLGDSFATRTAHESREMLSDESHRSDHQRLAAMPTLLCCRVDHAPAHSQRRALVADLEVSELSSRMAT